MGNRIESWRMAAKPVISLVLAAAVHVAPAATVGRVFARQMWPWQTHFEVSYVLETAQSEAVDVSLKVSSGDTEFSIPASELLGETKGLTSGEYRLVWDSAASSAPTAQWLLDNSGKLQFTVVTEAAEQPAEYLVIDLSGGPGAESWPAKRIVEKPQWGWDAEYKTTKLVLRRIYAGGSGDVFSSDDGVSFMFGCTSADPKFSDDFTAQKVTLTNDYWIGIFELTQKQYQLITGKTISSPFVSSGAYPQTKIGYYTEIRGSDTGSLWPVSSDVDETSLMGILRKKVSLPRTIPAGWKFDLPTEAQWEYACRAGTEGPWNNGGAYSRYVYKTKANDDGTVSEYEGDRNLDLVGWNPAICNIGEASEKSGSEVGLKLPNAWGLFDMHGNAAEFCVDSNYAGTTTNGRKGVEPAGYPRTLEKLLESKMARVVKGGAYYPTWTSTIDARQSWAGHRSCSHVRTYAPASAANYTGCRIVLRNSAANAGH